MKKLWKLRPQTPELTVSLAREFSIFPAIAQILVHRGLTHSNAAAFLQPRLSALSDPFLLPDMDKAVDRINRAIQAKEKIVIFGDYDVDGMTSIALLLEILGKLGAICGFYLPSRFVDGYGLKTDSIRRCIDDGARLIVCADCGTNSLEEIRYAKSHGVDVIVLDHHEHDGVPTEAVALVNPKRKDHTGYKEELASVGIAFKLAHALLKRRRENAAGADAGEIDLKDVLDYVALGTVADMVPLLGENRILVRAGLERFGHAKHPGLRILRDVAGLGAQLGAMDLAFRIAPRLNANGRLSDAQDALALLRTQGESQAMVLAQKLHQENARRQQIEQQATQEAIALVRAKHEYQKDLVLVLHHPRWHIGVVGIVAAKLTKEFGKPAVVIGEENGVGKGSARSIEGFDVTEALAASAAELLGWGGHANAGGLTVEPSRVEAFRASINRYAAQILTHREFVHNIHLDMELLKEDLNGDLIEQLSCLEPFGMGNPKPMFATHKVSVEAPPQIIGKKHLKFKTRIQDAYFEVMGFRMAEQSGAGTFLPVMGRKLDIAYHPCVNTFNGQRRYQLNLEDFRFSV